MNIDNLKKIGNEWIKGDMHRIYIDDLPRHYGLNAKYYNSGKIMSATFRGDEISNTQAREIEGRFIESKVWFDVKTGEFQQKNVQPKAFARIVESVKAECGE